MGLGVGVGVGMGMGVGGCGCGVHEKIHLSHYKPTHTHNVIKNKINGPDARRAAEKVLLRIRAPTNGTEGATGIAFVCRSLLALY